MTDTPLFIFSSGKATRLRPLSYLIPKPSLPWTNRWDSMLDLNIKKYRMLGFRKIYITYSYGRNWYKRVINKYTNDLDIILIHEPEPVGHIKSLINLGNELKDFDTICCQNGDTLSKFDINLLSHSLKHQDVVCAMASSKNIALEKNIICNQNGYILGLKLSSGSKMYFPKTKNVKMKNNIGTFLIKTKYLSQINNDDFVGIFGDNDFLDQLSKKGLYGKCVNVKTEMFYSFNRIAEYLNIIGSKVNV